MIVPFKAEHLNSLAEQDAQLGHVKMMIENGHAQNLEGTYAYSLIVDDAVLCCGGLLQAHPGRSIGWALVSKEAGKHFRVIHKNCAAAIRMCPDKRVEITVDTEFEEGHRWARMLGMKREGTMRKYSPDGRDHDLYARVK